MDPNYGTFENPDLIVVYHKIEGECPQESSVWTSLFNTKRNVILDGKVAESSLIGCYRVEWGHARGPKLPEALIKRWTIEFFKENKESLNLYCINCISPWCAKDLHW